MDLDKFAQIFLVANDFISEATGVDISPKTDSKPAEIYFQLLERIVWSDSYGHYYRLAKTQLPFRERKCFCRYEIQDDKSFIISNNDRSGFSSDILERGFIKNVKTIEECRELILKHIHALGMIYIGEDKK